MTFQTGISGNPTGRPKGSGSRQRLFNSLVAPHQDALIETAIKLALGGNEAMLRLFLDRLLPDKFVNEPLDISGKDVREKISKLINHVSEGELSADEARKIASIIQKDAEISNQATLVEKLTLLEEKLKSDKTRDIRFNNESINSN